MSRNDGPLGPEDLPVSEEIDEVQEHQEDRLDTRELAHGRALLRTVLQIIEWQERAPAWPILKRHLRDKGLACLVNADRRTVLLDPGWLEFIAAIAGGSEYRLERGGELVFDQALALRRGLRVPAAVSSISFSYADLAQLWPDGIGVQHQRWDRRPTRYPTVEFFNRVVRPAAVVNGCLFLRSAVAVVGEWERTDPAEAWQIIRRGIQVGNLQVWARAEGQAVKIEPAWIDFVQMRPDGTEYQADGSGEIAFDHAKAAVYDLAVPARVVAIKIKLDELQRIWPGCVTAGPRRPPIVVRPQAKPTIEGHQPEPLARRVPREGSSIDENAEPPLLHTQVACQPKADNKLLSPEKQVFKALDHLNPSASLSIKEIVRMVIDHCQKKGARKWSDRSVARHVKKWREKQHTSCI